MKKSGETLDLKSIVFYTYFFKPEQFEVKIL